MVRRYKETLVFTISHYRGEEFSGNLKTPQKINRNFLFRAYVRRVKLDD